MDNLARKPRFEGSQLIVHTNENVQSYDARFLISILLVYVAKSDGGISEVESNKMLESLSSQLHISDSEALESLSSAVNSLANDSDLAGTLQNISRGLSAEEKNDIFTMMLDVMAADENQHPGEIAAVEIAGQILGLSQNPIHSRLRAFSSGG